MISWSKILTSENYYDSPVPHFRIYNVLSSLDHAILYSKYDETFFATDSKFGKWTPKTPTACKHWKLFLRTIWDSGNILKQSWETHTKTSITQNDEILGLNLSHHAYTHEPGKRVPGMTPGDLLKDWHLDGQDKKLSMIYYLGTPEMTHGEIEFMNANNKNLEPAVYPYRYNSMVIWMNDAQSLHRFRSSNDVRRTVYGAWG